jgi:hypothetical protein
MAKSSKENYGMFWNVTSFKTAMQFSVSWNVKTSSQRCSFQETVTLQRLPFYRMADSETLSGLFQ